MAKNVILNIAVSVVTAMTCFYVLPHLIEAERSSALYQPVGVALNKQSDIEYVAVSEVAALRGQVELLTKEQARYAELLNNMNNSLDDTTSFVVDVMDDVEYKSETTLSEAEVLQQEAKIIQDAYEKIEQLDYDMSQQGTESAWSSEMEVELSEISNKLEAFNQGATVISNQECRSSTCRVVFAHDEGADLAMLPMIIATKGSRDVTLRQVTEGGQTRTVAYYQK